MILHLIQDSPEQSSALKACLRYATKQDCILLSGNGVNSLLKQTLRSQLSEYTCVALQEDVEARGLMGFLNDIKLVNYNEFVALSLTHDKVISW
ncbi:DsrH family protein [Shewanella halifaxensis HAW-EB4]|uniref:DsrH family protein n=1 Tax=Shewanella halifaxensis (strain HAW-EB4) TaxID=458817 RepID=B0TTS1_SHEHH|nr:sulfurtransferase complex subunit TusB [Shewanella halifaxensis]ABZ76639.1 DsrH family protein [Shewanella halifaxensis HAW-EB4]